MPAAQAPGPGTSISSITSGRLDVLDDLVGGATLTSEPIQVVGLPRLYLWMRQSVGAVGASVQVQFSVTAVGGVLTWLPLAAPFVVAGAGGPPLLLDYSLPANFLRVRVTSPAAQPTRTQVYLAASV